MNSQDSCLSAFCMNSQDSERLCFAAFGSVLHPVARAVAVRNRGSLGAQCCIHLACPSSLGSFRHRTGLSGPKFLEKPEEMDASCLSDCCL